MNEDAVSLMGDLMAQGYPVSQRERLKIFGTEGSILLAGDRLRLLADPVQEVVLDLAANYKASYRVAIAHFLDRLEDGPAFETAPEDNPETLLIVESAHRNRGLPRPRAPDNQPMIHRHEATSP